MKNKVRWDSSPVYGPGQLTPRERAVQRGNILLAVHEQLLTDEDRGENTVTPPDGELGLNSTTALHIAAEDAIAAVLVIVMELDAAGKMEAQPICDRAMKRVGIESE